MIGKLMKDWAGNLKRGEVCACFVFAVLFAWPSCFPSWGSSVSSRSLFSRSGYRSSRFRSCCDLRPNQADQPERTGRRS